MSDSVLERRVDGVAIVTFNRPDVLNAVDVELRDRFIDVMRRLNVADDVRAVILTGTGERAFCAGQDLSVSLSLDADTVGDWFRPLHGFYQCVRDMDKPVVAALNGVATGAGFQVALHSDMRVAHPGVRLGQPEVNAGMASIIGSMIMRETIGLSRTAELALSCRLVPADEARGYGLLSEIVEAEHVLPRAIEIANKIASLPPVAVRLTKQRIREVTQAAYDDAIAASIDMQPEAYRAGEPQGAAAAFVARRSARS